MAETPPEKNGSEDRVTIADAAPAKPVADSTYAPSALPSTTARVLAFGAILLGGLCGGLIGWSLIDLTCEDGDCTVTAGLAGVVGAVIGAVGVAVVAVLALRAMGEWRTIQARDAAEPPAPGAHGRAGRRRVR